MSKEVTLREIIEYAEKEVDKAVYDDPIAPQEVFDKFDAFVGLLNQLEERIGKIQAKLGMGNLAIKNKGFDIDSWYAGAKWVCNGILGEEVGK